MTVISEKEDNAPEEEHSQEKAHFCFIHSIVHHVLNPQGQTVTKEFYLRVSETTIQPMQPEL